MKIVLYMASTINGMIAKENDDTSWISKKEWDSYSSAVRKAGNIIVGRRTYHILTNQPEFSEFKNVKLVVVSKQKFLLVGKKHFIARSPKEALRILKNFRTIVVAGGGILNSSFLSENLVDEIYLDVEPDAIGKGIPLFAPADFHKKLKLMETKKISKNEVQLHYKVLKK